MDQKTVELAPFGNIEIDGDKYPQDLSYSVSTVYCETPEEKWNPSPDIHLGKLEHWFSIFLTASGSPKFQELSSRLCCCSHQLEVARGCPAKINMVTQAAPSREETPQNQDNSYSRGGRPRDSATCTEDNELIETEIEREWQNADHSEPVNFGVNEVTGEKQQDDQDPEEVITYREIRTPDETLLLGVAIPDQPQLTKCVAFVDTGAEVIIAFKLATDYMLRSNRFIIIPDEVTEYDVVIGYDVLKREHLLPDPCAKELVVQKYTTIEVRTRPELSEDQVMLVESEEKLPKKVSIDPALVKFHQNRAILIIRNDDDRPKKLQKGSIIGKMETLEDSHPSIGFELVEPSMVRMDRRQIEVEESVPRTRSKGKCQDLPLVFPYLLERKRNEN
ncbi:hypothetical protein Avbf_18153 [Armadillidium vulgare]|nr:hypothetical protein Avbf_18153 [Armadillidium vulgare]